MRELTDREKEILERGLPKWPALLVSGTAVTRDEACEILIRTNGFGFRFLTNDKEWERQLLAVLGVDDSNDYDRVNEVELEYHLMELEYLANWQIASSWIGGAHGWCGWNGTIFANSFNVGKWPSGQELYRECVALATAFPFLQATFQLLDKEQSEEDPQPVMNLEVKSGGVFVHEPIGLLVPPGGLSMESMAQNFLSPYRERGCPLDTFKEALETTRRRLTERAVEA